MKNAREGGSERLPMISFRADKEILAVLAKLEAAVDDAGGGVVLRRRRRSIAIRRALLEAGERLSTRSVQEKTR